MNRVAIRAYAAETSCACRGSNQVTGYLLRWEQPLLPSGRYWDRTSDLFRVREARYRCANRPFLGLKSKLQLRWIPDSNRCGRLCRPLPRLSANPPNVLPHLRELSVRTQLERMTRLELATLTLARLCATNCATSACILSNALLTLVASRGFRKTRPAGNRPLTISTKVETSSVTYGALRAIGAVGSALPSHGRGHQFESGIAHTKGEGHPHGSGPRSV